MATFYGTTGQDTINGTSLDDFIYGYPFGGDPESDDADTLSGGDGNDWIDGGGGFRDLISGDDGDDTLLSGGGLFDTLDGGQGNDVLDSQSPGGHTLIDGPAAVSGNDTLIGAYRAITHGGADQIDGATTWEAHYEDSADALALSPGSTPGAYALTGGTTAKDVSHLEFYAGAGNDTIVTGGRDDLVVDGRADAAGDDVISTGRGNDTVTTYSGSDTVDTGEGNDLSEDGADFDLWFGHFEGESADLTSAWDGDSELSISNGATIRNFEQMTFYSGSGNDSLAGTGVGDVIYDAPVGVGSNDTVRAGSGDDLVVTYGGVDDVDGGEPPAGALYEDFDRWEGHYESASADLTMTWQAALAGWSLSNGTVAKNVELLTFFSGSGDDTLEGSSGSDTIDGNGGDDFIDARGPAGSNPQAYSRDELYGGTGSDTLISGNDADLLVDGGAGDDGNDMMQAGAGDDEIVSLGGIDDIDGGDGNDRLELHLETLDEAIILDLSATDSAAFSNGFKFTNIEAVRLYSGTGDDVITLSNAPDAVSLLASNYVDGGDGDDHIRSLDASVPGTDDSNPDELVGGAGNDTLEGAFFSSGGSGDDLLVANDGARFQDDEYTPGCNLFGEGGDDTLIGGFYTDLLFGGDGDDLIQAVSSQQGGYGYLYYDALSGGSGADTLIGGDGADLFGAGGDADIDLLTGGLGNDEYRLGWRLGAAVDIITDFAAGANGDSLGILGLIPGRNWYEAPYDPWAEGYLRLKQDGADTLLQVDQDGAAGGQDWETVVILQDTVATDLTFENFESWPSYSRGEEDFYAQQYQPVYAPDDAPPIVGGSGDDVLGGTKLADVINGAAGDDTLRGGGGNDSVCGGTGDDVLRGAAGDDSLLGARGDDRLRGGGGADSIDGGRGDDTIYGDGGNDTIAGGAGDDRLRGGGGLDTIKLSAGFGDDVLLDYGDGDTLIFDAPLVGGAGGQADSVAELRALVEAAPNVTVQISGNGVVLEFSSGDSLTLGNVADEWAVA